VKRAQINFKNGFRVLARNRTSQVTEMTLPPGTSEGGPTNSHRGSSQWLYIHAGKGKAIVAGKHYSLKAKTLILIKPREVHEIRNTGRTLLKTLNFYVPPAYSQNGKTLPAGRPA
jgi:mannose-6-phosphate isomerase-like protein (cupin superfamily)